jgi:hypothetical protein
MTTPQDAGCDAVLAAAMAALDGEAPLLPGHVLDAHLRTCARCRESASEMRALQASLDGLAYPGPGVDLWPGIGGRIGATTRPVRERTALALIALLAVAWRTGQLLFEWPLPVLNALVPLAVLLMMTAWLIGDPLAIRMTTPELRQERA